MPTKVIILPEFEKDLKHLKRKYPAVTKEVRNLIVQLENDERVGDKIPDVGYEVYKARLSNPSASRGKSGGFRAIYYVQLADKVVLLILYSKTEQANISPEKIRKIIDELEAGNEELETPDSEE